VILEHRVSHECGRDGSGDSTEKSGDNDEEMACDHVSPKVSFKFCPIIHTL